MRDNSALRYDRLVAKAGGIEASHRWLLDRVPDGATVLDCGCAGGYLASALQERGDHVVDGIEVDPRAARCAGAFCRAVYVGSLEDPSFLTTLTGCYDRILFGDVLEHLVDPESVLRNVVRLLAPEGRILVSLPNIAYWQIRLRLLAGQFAYAESGILDRTHVRFFTYNTARELAGAAGLRIVEHTFTSRLPGTNLAPWLALPVARAFPNLFAYQTLMELEPCPA